MKQCVRLFCVFVMLLMVSETSALSQSDPPPVLAQDDLLPSLGSVMLDPSNHPVTYSSVSFFDVFTEVSLDFSGSSRLAPPAVPRVASLTCSASMRRRSGPNTWYAQDIPCNVTVNINPRPPVGDQQIFDTEMLQLDISGGGLLGGVMIRESPTLQSLGQTTVKPVSGGFMINSFFDVFTELSVDGGATWTPADGSIRLEAKILPSVSLFNPPSAFPRGIAVADIDQDGLSDFRVNNNGLPTVAITPPVGSSVTHSFLWDTEINLPGVNGIVRNAPGTVYITHTHDEGSTQFFDTEMLQLDISGGTLPSGTMIRESPSKQSVGRTSIRSLPSGQYEVSSFFDIFTELSVDGGSTWTPRSPATLEFKYPLPIDDVPPAITSENSMPPLGSIMVDPSNQQVTFPASSFFDIFTDVTLDFAGSPRVKPPMPGGSVTQTITGTATFRMSLDGGATFQRYTAPLSCVQRTTSSVDDGTTRYFDTEMLSLDISGGTLPLGVMIRESPSKQSLERSKQSEAKSNTKAMFTAEKAFLELSTDGGGTWTPSDNSLDLEMKIKPTVLINRPDPPPPFGRGIAIGDLDGDGREDLVVMNLSDSPIPTGGATIVHSGTMRPYYQDRVGNESVYSVKITHKDDDGSDHYYDTEMLQLDISGGTLPPGTMIRESPSKQSLGRTSVRQMSPGQYEVSSFFDIFTELSVDGGSTWAPQPAATLAFLDSLRESPTLNTCLPVATFPDDLYPLDGYFMSPPGTPAIQYANGMRARGIITVKPSAGAPRRELPSLGASDNFLDIDQDCDMQISPGPGMPFQDVHLTGTMSVHVTHSSDDGNQRTYQTEMLQLNLVSAGGVMIRESPTLQSTGQITVKPNGSGYAINSFFDVFTEISVDGGGSWSPDPNETLIEVVLAIAVGRYPSTNFPPPGEYEGSSDCGEVTYGNGVVLRRPSFFDIFTDVALPPPQGSSTNSATGRCRLEVSLDGGNSFFDIFTEVALSTHVVSTNNTPTTRFFDTEMLSMSLTGSGGGGGSGGSIMLRESPTLQSLGKTTLRESPTLIGSFFDIFTEISLDDGNTWSPASSSLRLTLDTLKNGTITGMKWHDTDGNGIKDGSETGLANWQILLTDTLYNIIDSAFTDPVGNYSFSNVPSGTYRVLELGQSGWIQTGGSPIYGFWMVPGDTMKGNDFGNFQAPVLTGYKFSDHNSDGVRDLPGDEGVPDWDICLYPKQIPNPGIEVNSGTGIMSIRLNGLPPGEPVIGTLSAYAAVRKGWDGTIKGRAFENGQIPIELLSLELQSINPVVIDGNPYSFKIKLDSIREYRKEYVGHVTLLKSRLRPGKVASGSEPQSSFFDVFFDLEIVPRPPFGSGPPPPSLLHFGITLEADLDADGQYDPLRKGMVYTGGPVDLLDDAGLSAGTLDSLSFTVGDPASQLNPICTKTDGSGQYSFSPLLPGVWNILEVEQPCWDPTTSVVPPILSTSGGALPPIDFGNHQNLGEICVTKYWDVNHNQNWEPATEPPMAGVTFVLTGASNTFNAVTNGSGKACFENLPPDSYTLTEILPAGYTYSNPKSGQVGPLVITGCEEYSDLVWLNTAESTADSFRTARYEDWALAVDQKGKPKPIKAKDDKVVLKFNIVSPREGFTGFELDFGMLTTGQVTEGKAKLVVVGTPFTAVKKVAFTGLTIDSLDTFQIDAIGAKGKKAKVKVKWTGRLLKPLTLKQTLTDYKRNDPQLPMPNFHNVGQELFGFGQASYFPTGLLIGIPQGDKKANSVVHLKYSDVLKSLVKYKDGVPITHEDSIRCLDIYPGGALMKSQVKGLAPDKNSNKLFGELLALKLNVAASVQGKFPVGLGELTYLNKAEPGNPFNDQTINEIIAKADSMISCLPITSKLTVPTVNDLYDVLTDINTAFYGDLDTVSFAVKTVLTGVRDLKSVSYLYAMPGVIPTINLPGARQPEIPLAYRLEQNYPNPFNPATTIQFDIPEQAMVTLKIYDMLGQEVATLLNNTLIDEGTTELPFDATNLSSGIYFYRITAQGLGDGEEGTIGQTFISVKKMMLVK